MQVTKEFFAYMEEDDLIPMNMVAYSGGLRVPRFQCLLCGVRLWESVDVSLHEEFHRRVDKDLFPVVE